MQKMNLIIGIVLIVLAAVLLAVNWSANPVSLSVIWPVFPILIGILFLSFYFANKSQVGFLMPAIILLLTGLAFLVCTLTTWDNMRYLWPVFILAPGIGFFLNYAAGQKEGFQLTWGAVLTVVALVFLFVRSSLEVLWPVLLLLIGLIFVFLHLGKAGKKEIPAGGSSEEKLNSAPEESRSEENS